MEDINFIRRRLQEIYLEIKEVIDLCAEVRTRSPEHKKIIAQLWQQFLSDVFSYIKQKSKETGQNLLAGISLFKVK